MEKIFVYGTLLKGFHNHAILARAAARKGARYLMEGFTKEKYIMFSNGSFPYVLKDIPQYSIKGEIYEVDSDAMRALDSLEGHPHMYKREKVTIILASGKETECWIYFYKMFNHVFVENGDFARRYKRVWVRCITSNKQNMRKDKSYIVIGETKDSFVIYNDKNEVEYLPLSEQNYTFEIDEELDNLPF